MVARAITIICKAHSDMDADTPKVALGKSELELYMPLCCLLGFI